MLLDGRRDQVRLHVQVGAVLLAVGGQQFGDALPVPDAPHEGLQFDEATQAAVYLLTAVVFFVLGPDLVLLHQTRLLLQLVLT